MHNLTQEEIQGLEDAKTDDEWDRICDEIKMDRKGSYPPDWYEIVIVGNINPSINKQISIKNY